VPEDVLTHVEAVQVLNATVLLDVVLLNQILSVATHRLKTAIQDKVNPNNQIPMVEMQVTKRLHMKISMEVQQIIMASMEEFNKTIKDHFHQGSLIAKIKEDQIYNLFHRICDPSLVFKVQIFKEHHLLHIIEDKQAVTEYQPQLFLLDHHLLIQARPLLLPLPLHFRLLQVLQVHLQRQHESIATLKDSQ